MNDATPNFNGNDTTPDYAKNNEDKIIKEFKENYEEEYKDILPTDILQDGVKWHLDLLLTALEQQRGVVRQQQRTDLIEKLQKAYGVDGQPTLVILEDNEDGGTTQRPALDDIIKIIKSN